MSGEATRARLLSLLSEACELEHALCCSYLFAAFSIKREIGEGLDWREQQLARKWASQIYHIAAQEMLHLAQAWNLLTAVGGTPYYQRPNFPQPARNFPLNVALSLRRFDVATLERFIYYENPSHEAGPLALREAMPAMSAWPLDETYAYTSVGQLYGECARIIEILAPNGLFIGGDDQQIGQSLIDFYDVIAVTDLRTALQAIERIMLQGEGLSSGREDSHFGVFNAILCELKARPDGFDLARKVGDNPYVHTRPPPIASASDYRVQAVGLVMTPIRDPTAMLAADLFDDVYVSMLQALAHVFSNATRDKDHLRIISRSALELMITVIKPLGEALCLLPSGKPGVNAGPTFALNRHAQLPPVATVARRVYAERLQQLADHGHILMENAIADPIAAGQLASAAANLKRIARAVSGEGPALT